MTFFSEHILSAQFQILNARKRVYFQQVLSAFWLHILTVVGARRGVEIHTEVGLFFCEFRLIFLC